MSDQGIQIEELPELKNPILIIGFDGWGNAMNISKGMAAYLIRTLEGKEFAKINSDRFYRYDATRPWVSIEQGVMKSLSMPGGSFYAVKTGPDERDVVILNADEPNLRWYEFVDDVLTLCEKLGVDTIISLGSMYDNVLHTERIVSGIATKETFFPKLGKKNVNFIYYQGPSSIHTLFLSQGPKRGIECMSLWCHCPYYLQDTVHYGLLSHLGDLLSTLGEFTIDRSELEKSWEKLNDKIEELIENKPELQTVIDGLRKAKSKGLGERRRNGANKGEKVIQLEDYLEPD
jgi:proteasome assembly chaperone (PAC2) family protein